ncbi:hypothetical protein TNCV_4571941 [Trichonephila clavipes]|nr:hypothetical protein TNCV_4571941 [Trichonephila clavipes]
MEHNWTLCQPVLRQWSRVPSDRAGETPSSLKQNSQHLHLAWEESNISRQPGRMVGLQKPSISGCGAQDEYVSSREARRPKGEDDEGVLLSNARFQMLMAFDLHFSMLGGAILLIIPVAWGSVSGCATLDASSLLELKSEDSNCCPCRLWWEFKA